MREGVGCLGLDMIRRNTEGRAAFLYGIQRSPNTEGRAAFLYGIQRSPNTEGRAARASVR